MREFVPAFASVENNPADITPLDADAIALGACVVALEAPETDCVMLILGAEDLVKHQGRLEDLAIVSRASNTPLAIGLAGVDAFGILPTEAKIAMAEMGLPVFSSPVRAVKAVAMINSFEFSSNPTPQYADSEAVPKVRRESPAYDLVREMLEHYGVCTPLDEVVDIRFELTDVLPNISYPIVAKLLGGEDSSHKSDLSLVRAGVRNLNELRRVRDEFVVVAEKLWPTVANIRLLLQEQVSTESVEVLVGATRHPEFGPVIVVGSGGVMTELLHDLQYSLAPLTRNEAKSLLGRTKIAKRISGYRGDSGFDADACVEAIVSVSRLISEHDELCEFEINPLIVTRSGAYAVDVRTFLARRDDAHDLPHATRDWTRRVGSLQDPRCAE
jgi:acetyltransferase